MFGNQQDAPRGCRDDEVQVRAQCLERLDHRILAHATRAADNQNQGLQSRHLQAS